LSPRKSKERLANPMGETENGGDELERYTVEGETGDYEFFF